jgi:hypothetical protein
LTGGWRDNGVEKSLSLSLYERETIDRNGQTSDNKYFKETEWFNQVKILTSLRSSELQEGK